MSLSNPDHYQPMDDAVHNAVSSGVVVVCSAGNLGPDSGTIKCPSDAPDAITVGSVNINNVVSSFSSQGPTWDKRTKPDIMAIGESVVSAMASGVSPLGTVYDPYYMSLDGTSMSTPQVSGISALLLQANHSLTPLQVKYAIMDTARRPDTNYPNNDSGWGLVDAGAAMSEVLSGTIKQPVPSSTPTPTPTATLLTTPTATPRLLLR